MYQMLFPVLLMMEAIKLILRASALPTDDVYYGIAIASGSFCFLRAHTQFEGVLFCRRVAACSSACLWMFDTARHTPATWTLSRKANCSSCQIFAGALERLARTHFYRLPPIYKASGDHFFCFLRISRLAACSPSPLIYIAPRRL